jgi:hypothetical protein
MPGGLPALLSRPAKCLAAAVFTFLDVLDVLLCLVYAALDAFLEDGFGSPGVGVNSTAWS